MSNKEESKYSTKLFDKQFDKIRIELDNFCNSNSISFKGLWAFAYLVGANSLKSIYFNHVDIDRLKKDYEGILIEIERTRLDCDYGSLGFAFQTLNGNNNSSVEFLRDTYNDAKGTVCYFDLIISQEHACFVIIKKGNEVLGVLDFFFDGNLTQEYENKIVSFFQERFNSHTNQQYLTDFINAFKIQEYGYFLELQNEENGDVIKTDENKKELSNAAEHIERIMAASSITPLMVIKHQKGKYFPELVVLNFDFIHSLIKHEHRFCPLTTGKDCFHFKGYNSFINHALKCDNNFLKLFYYDILKELNANVITYKIKVVDIEYNIEIVFSNKDLSIEKSNFSELSNEVKKIHFSSYIANNKYRDERVYLALDNILKDDERVYAFSLSRKTKPHLKFSAQRANDDKSDCCQRNDCVSSVNHEMPIKQFISPSTILPVQYEQITNPLLIKYKSECKNIVHFKITNEQVFKQTQKRLIAINPDSYFAALKPYLNINTNGKAITSFRKNLIISLVGEHPLQDNKFAEIIKGKLNLIQALLQEEEIKLQARKAAIIQYMARNLSHNTGSHLIPEAIIYFREHLNEKEGAKFAYYQKYTQERMELLAQLSSMKNNHNWTNYNLNDIIEEFDGSIIPKGLCDDLNNNQKEIEIKLKSGLENIIVSLPDGAVGKQAFYVILENFVRNAYKHAEAGSSYLFEINVSKPSDDKNNSDFWCLDLYDKLGSLNEYSRTDHKLEYINNLIKSSVLTEDAQLRERGWGLLEMKSAAAFLVGFSLEYLDDFHLNNFETKYYETTTPATKKNLGHRFYLRKPSLLIIDEDLATPDQKSGSEELKSKGIAILNVTDINTKREPHQFIITNKEWEYTNQKIISENIDTDKSITEIENDLWLRYIDKKKWKTTKIIGSQNEQNDGGNEIAYFDDHGKELKFKGNCLKNAKQEDITQLNLPFYHPYTSRSGIKSMLLKSKDENVYKGLILEAVKTNILIIDERIQNASKTKDNEQPNLSLQEIFTFMGITVPKRKELSLSDFLENPTEKKREKIIELIQDKKFNYVMLHLTILEKLASTNDKLKLGEYIKYKNGLNEHENFVSLNRALVLVSGRGEPPNLPGNSYYLNYTTLYDCLIYLMSKPHFVQILSTIRKR